LHRPTLEDISAAALVVQPFAVLVAVLLVVAPPNVLELRASDPIIQSLAQIGARTLRLRSDLLLVPILSVVTSIAWLVVARPSRACLRRAVELAGSAVLLALVAIPLLRLAVGPSLPTFIPPEESARPGVALGLAAGLVEELAFRLTLLPALLLLLARRQSLTSAAVIAVAIAVTSIGFAAAHEIGPGAGEFSLAFFLDRLVLPGALMSVAFFWPGPAFIVTLHCMAHVLLPLLFR
jgi:hypothetical protein